MSAPVFLSLAAADAEVGGLVTLTGGEARHAATVQRRAVGERIDVADGRGVRASGLIEAIREGEVDVRVDAITVDGDVPITLVQALAKGGRDELAIETATELGVTAVVPWDAERCIVQWRGPKADKARAGWQATVAAAAKQARRALVPTVASLVTTRQLADSVRQAVAQGARVLILHEDAATPLGSLQWADAAQPVWLIVGPEGGISESEVAVLIDAGAEAAVLGPHVLRASTAGSVAIAALAVLRGTWH